MGVVPTGPTGVTLTSTYSCRDDPRYKEDLGNAVVNLARMVPDGLLVFFPSYTVMTVGGAGCLGLAWCRCRCRCTGPDPHGAADHSSASCSSQEGLTLTPTHRTTTCRAAWTSGAARRRLAAPPSGSASAASSSRCWSQGTQPTSRQP